MELLVLLQVAYENQVPSIFNPFRGQYNSFRDLLFLGFLGFFFLSVIRYYGAKIFSDEQGLAVAKSEIMDSIAVALLILGIYTSLQAVEYVAQLAYPMYFSQGPVGMFDGFIIPTIWDTMVNSINLANKHALEATQASKGTRFSLSIFSYPIFGDTEFNDVKKVNELLFRSQLEASIAVALSVAYAAVNYIKDAAGYFLVVGLMARIFPVFRGVGAFLISLGLGFYYIYPLVTAMFLFGIPQIDFKSVESISIDQAFCRMKATGALILPEQDLAVGFRINLGNPQSVEEDFGLVISTDFLLSQLVALSLTAMFINNLTLILGKGLYVGSNITSVLNRMI